MSLKDRKSLPVEIVGVLNPLKTSKLNTNCVPLFTNVYVPTQLHLSLK